MCVFMHARTRARPHVHLILVRIGNKHVFTYSAFKVQIHNLKTEQLASLNGAGRVIRNNILTT